jgi:hypothetical protein
MEIGSSSAVGHGKRSERTGDSIRARLIEPFCGFPPFIKRNCSSNKNIPAIIYFFKQHLQRYLMPRHLNIKSIIHMAFVTSKLYNYLISMNIDENVKYFCS